MGSSSQAKHARRLIKNWEGPEGWDQKSSEGYMDVVVSEMTTLNPKQIKRAKQVVKRKTK